MPDSTSQGQQSSQEGSEQSSQQQGDAGANQQQAAEDLKRAGQQVADAGAEVGGQPPSSNGVPSGDQETSDGQSGGGFPEMPQDPMMQPGAGEWDPMMPDSDQSSSSDSEIFADSDTSEAAGSTGAESDQTNDASNEGDMSASSGSTDLAASSSGQPSSGQPNSSSGQESAEVGSQVGDESRQAGNESTQAGGDISDEILAAQEAMIEAGIALQTAGEALENAASDEELRAAEEALANARVLVIVAGQDLAAARDNAEPGTEGVYADAEETLNAANGALVVATNTIMSSRIELPEASGSGGDTRVGELEAELEKSLGVFEGEILAARRTITDTTPPPNPSANSLPGQTTISESARAEGELMEDAGMQPGEEMQQGRVADADQQKAQVAVTETPPVPEGIPDPQGDDIVAQQLREAAVAETDPDLQAKLWEEYKRYKAGL